MIAMLGYLVLGFLWTVIAISIVGVWCDLATRRHRRLTVTRSDNVTPIRRLIYDREQDGD